MRFITLVIASVILVGQADTKQELIAKEDFDRPWKLPQEFTDERITTVIQQAVDSIYNKGFRYLGVDGDFFHGHVLFTMDKLTSEGRLLPFAVLYHTQEDAKKAHWGDKIDKKFDYLNVQNRNWIQWLDAGREYKVENAKHYADETEEDLRLYFEVTQPIEGEAFTIHAKNLDQKKLGYDVVGELQFEFYKGSCNEQADYYSRGPIRVTMPNGEGMCLMLSTGTTFIDWDDWNF
jgi:hypothetical protein